MLWRCARCSRGHYRAPPRLLVGGAYSGEVGLVGYINKERGCLAHLTSTPHGQMDSLNDDLLEMVMAHLDHGALLNLADTSALNKQAVCNYVQRWRPDAYCATPRRPVMVQVEMESKS